MSVRRAKSAHGIAPREYRSISAVAKPPDRDQHCAVKSMQLTALLEREGDGYVALCPELDVASQGDNLNEALSNLREAVELFLECAPPEEVESRYHAEVFVTRFEAAYA
jgi:predicted RNase H-like HicB family nuclease